MTADTPTPTPPEDDPQPATRATDATSDPADAPTARHDAPRPSAASAAPDAPPAGLYRSRGDRMLAGVCGGIAARYGIDAVIVRLAFLASLLIGGAGVLFYVAAAIVIPNPPADRDGGPVDGDATGGTTVSVGNGILRILVALAVALGVFCGLAAVAGLSFATTVFFGAWPAAVVLVVLGALLAAVARNRRSAAAVLVMIVAVAAPAAAAAIADLSVDRSAGERTETPAVAADAADGYRLGLGSLIVDLRELPLRPGTAPLEVPVRVDVGRAAIVIPDDRCVAWTIRTTTGVAGDVQILGRPRHDSWAGYRQRRTYRINPGGGDRRPQVTIDAHVGIGEIVVGTTIRQIEHYRDGERYASSSLRTAGCRGEGARRP